MFEEFSPKSKREWLDKIEQDLKGQSPDVLNWHYEPGLEIAPFAHPDDLHEAPTAIVGDQKGLHWLIGEDFSGEQPADELNAGLLKALQYGLESPRIAFRQMPSLDYVERMLQGVELSFIVPYFFIEEAEEEELSELVHFLYHFYRKSLKDDSGAALFAGSLCVGSRAMALKGARLAKAKELLPAYRFIRISSFGTAREGLVEGLKDILDHAMLAFGESRLSMESFNRLLQFDVELGRDYFPEIARLRALRLLWFNVLKQHDVSSATLPFLNVSLVLHDTREVQLGFDEELLQQRVNEDMIAAAPLALAALLGGANRLTIPPAGSPLQKPDDFTRRIARNVHYILRYESGIDRVADPLAGSYYVELLTARLMEQFR